MKFTVHGVALSLVVLVFFFVLTAQAERLGGHDLARTGGDSKADDTTDDTADDSADDTTDDTVSFTDDTADDTEQGDDDLSPKKTEEEEYGDSCSA